MTTPPGEDCKPLEGGKEDRAEITRQEAGMCVGRKRDVYKQKISNILLSLWGRAAQMSER
jgi:hypothetical protein